MTQFTTQLERSKKNPILEAKIENKWENKCVFNPAALYLDNKVHLIYRASGDEGISVFGYASSSNGIQIDERLSTPIFPSNNTVFEFNTSKKINNYVSGPTCVGCEDPRLVCIDGTIYMTYTSFADWNTLPGVAFTSISVSDFLNKQWNWSKPKIISSPNEIHKNWVLFPEKINGKYAMLHSISPSIKLEYLDSLEFAENQFIDSCYSPTEHQESWDNWLRGAGAPPIKTDHGWLLLYHAMDRCDPNRYKLGVMLLDSKDPTKIKSKLPYPLLEPDAWYENHGFKSGVIYNCGAVVIQDELFIYYGGADHVVCVGYIQLSDLLKTLNEIIL